jgi:hypothetical protein
MTNEEITFYNIPEPELTFAELRDGDIFITAHNDHIVIKGTYPGQQHLPNMPPPNYFDPRWPTLYARCGNLWPVKRLNSALGVMQQKAGLYD